MTKKEKEIERVIDRAYRENCRGMQLNLLDIPKVFAHGRELLAQGVSESALGPKIREYVQGLAP